MNTIYSLFMNFNTEIMYKICYIFGCFLYYILKIFYTTKFNKKCIFGYDPTLIKELYK